MTTKKPEKISVSFNAKRCIHARRCVLGLPDVFQGGADGQWIFPEKAPVEDVVAVVSSCPSGALSYQRHDDSDNEKAPQVNTVRMWENGPNEFKGDLHIGETDKAFRRLLCRCGKSEEKPYCDNSHIEASFCASSDAEVAGGETPEKRDGTLDISPMKNGPLSVSGPLEVIAGSGKKIATGEKHYLCRCGASNNKPFCDGSHKSIDFQAD